MQDHTFTLVVSAVGMVGALGGIVVGHFLTRSGQHEQWVRDNRKQEFRELLTSLSAAYLHIVQYGSGDDRSDSSDLRFHPVRNEAFRALHDRIFIAQEIRKAEIFRKWLRLVDTCNASGHQSLQSPDDFSILTSELVNMALNDPRGFRWWGSA